MSSGEGTIAQLTETVRLQALQIERLTALLAEKLDLQALQIERLTALLAEKLDYSANAGGDTALTVRQLFDAYEKAKGATHSWKNASNRLAPLVTRLGELRVLDLTPKVWAAHRAARVTRKKRPLAIGTLNLELAYAKAMLNWAASPEQQLIPRNPLGSSRFERGAGRRERFLTEDEVSAIVRVADPMLRAFVLICADTGLRHNECRCLRREWIHRDGTIHLPGSITKSGKARVVALTQRAIDAIESLPSASEDAGDVFWVPRTGRLVPSRTLLWRFDRACKRAGVQRPGGERVVIHTLRHTAATAALRRGARLNSVQRMLGHSSLAITEKYLHLGEGDAVEVARLMADGAARERRAA